MKNDIRNINEDELARIIDEKGAKKFRAVQISEWLWKKGVSGWDEMRNIPLDLRKNLAETFDFRTAKGIGRVDSADGTKKMLFELYDGNRIEGVLIPSSDRTTACISTQAGCPLNCAFCATGQAGFRRNLEPGEIIDQFFRLNDLSLKDYGRPLSNVVLMGMGEPFLNLGNVQFALSRLSAPHYLNFSPTRITVSTIGIPEKIRELTRDDFPYNLALSLHSTQPSVRKQIIPSSARYPLDDLQDALAEYTRRTRKKVTVEFLLLKGVNDSVKEAESLVRYCSRFASKINLITYNEVPGLPFLRPDDSAVAQFLAALKKKNAMATLRKSMGSDISAACGQLANNSKLVK